jgi:hypothetical protein
MLWIVSLFACGAVLSANVLRRMNVTNLTGTVKTYFWLSPDV